MNGYGIGMMIFLSTFICFLLWLIFFLLRFNYQDNLAK